MAKNTLPVNFQDDIMNSSMGGKRRYKMINNSDGTISLEDATTYDQVGSNFGASQLNATNQAVNAAADAGKIIDDLDAINNVTQEGYIAGARALKQVNDSLGGLQFSLGTDGKGQYRVSGDSDWIPFLSDFEIKQVLIFNYGGTQPYINTIDVTENCTNAIVIYHCRHGAPTITVDNGEIIQLNKGERITVCRINNITNAQIQITASTVSGNYEYGFSVLFY